MHLCSQKHNLNIVLHQTVVPWDAVPVSWSQPCMHQAQYVSRTSHGHNVCQLLVMMHALITNLFCAQASLNDVALRDCQNCWSGRPNRDAQDRLLWRHKTSSACT